MTGIRPTQSVAHTALIVLMALLALAMTGCAGGPSRSNLPSSSDSDLATVFRDNYVFVSGWGLDWSRGPDEYSNPRYATDGRGVYLDGLLWAPNAEDNELRLYHVSSVADRNPKMVKTLPADLPPESLELTYQEPAVPNAWRCAVAPNGRQRIEIDGTQSDRLTEAEVRYWLVDVRTGAYRLLYKVVGGRYCYGAGTAWADDQTVVVAAITEHGSEIATIDTRSRSVVASIAVDGLWVDQLVTRARGAVLYGVYDVSERTPYSLYEFGVKSASTRRVGTVGRGGWDYCADRGTVLTLAQPFRLDEFTLP